MLIVDAQTLQHFGVVREIEYSARHDIFVGRIQDGVLARMERHPHAALADLRADVLEGFGVDVPPGERVDRARAERDQIRADSEQFDVVLAVVVDHPLQRGKIVLGHLRQLLRGCVPLHDAADVCVWCADVQTGIADGHGDSPFVQSSRWNPITALHIWISSRIFCGNPAATHRTSGCRSLRWRHRRDFWLGRSIRRRQFG